MPPQRSLIVQFYINELCILFYTNSFLEMGTTPTSYLNFDKVGLPVEAKQVLNITFLSISAQSQPMK